MDRRQFVITIDGRAEDEIIVRLEPRLALQIAQRILNQIDLRGRPDHYTASDVSFIIAGSVKETEREVLS